MKLQRLAALVAAAPLTMAAAAAFADSPGEAAAYAFLGVGDGVTLTRGQTTMSWKETGADPATFEGDVHVGPKSATIRFIVHSTDRCHYEITIEGPPAFVPGSSRLYGRVSMAEIAGVKVSMDGHKTEIDGSGFCETGQVNPACVSVAGADLFGSPDPARHRQAVAALKAECGRS